MIGRAYLWGLAANGQAGVENVLDILRAGIDSALLGLGHCSAHDLRRSDVIVPPGFERRLGCGEDARARTDHQAIESFLTDAERVAASAVLGPSD
jgi:hypothetical protein